MSAASESARFFASWLEVNARSQLGAGFLSNESLQTQTRSLPARASDSSFHSRRSASIPRRTCLHRVGQPTCRHQIPRPCGESSSPPRTIPAVGPPSSGVPRASASRSHRPPVPILLPYSDQHRLGRRHLAWGTRSEASCSRSAPSNKSLKLTAASFSKSFGFSPTRFVVGSSAAAA